MSGHDGVGPNNGVLAPPTRVRDGVAPSAKGVRCVQARGKHFSTGGQGQKSSFIM